MANGLDLDLSFSAGPFTLAVKEHIVLEGITGLFGASGSGKSTLLRILAGLETRARGRIAFNGTVWQDGRRIVPAHRRRVGMVFQDGRLFSHLDVRGNLAYGRKRAAETRFGFDQVVDALDLSPLLGRRTHAMSGGERQRVAIGRALLAAPTLLLLDEPLSALDEGRKGEILPYLERLRDDFALPMIHVSHSAAEMARLAGTVVVLDNGRITARGTASDVIGRPDLLGAGESAEAGAVIELAVRRQLDDDGLTELASRGGQWLLPRVAALPGATIRAHVRARDVMIATVRPEGISALNVISGRIGALDEPGDGNVLVRIDCAGDTILSRVTRHSTARLGLHPGMAVFAIIKAVSFDRAGAPADGGPPA
ncbi:MAG: molybdenum ABC transporter ATP-binding protein [Rhizobiaceae bacterium]